MDSDRPFGHNRGHVKAYPKEKFKPDKDDKERGNGNCQGKGKGEKQ
jgi:hypothetical protein